MSKQNNETMRMSPWDFDQSPIGWRRFEATKEYLKAASLIRDYITINKEKFLYPPKIGKAIDIEILYFHIGQLLALEGSDYYKEAIDSFKQSFRKNGECWNAYVDATIGFLENDISKIERSIEIINKSKDEHKDAGNIGIVNNFRKALLTNIRNYKEVYSWLQLI